MTSPRDLALSGRYTEAVAEGERLALLAARGKALAW